jgi:tetratricopeptide (TPR) repeat protein
LFLGLILVAIAVAVRLWVASNPVLRIPIVENKEVHAQVANLLNEKFSVVVKSPESSEAWGEYGIVLMAHGFREEAAECYEEAARFDPEDYRWPYYHGVTVAVGDRNEALRDFERALEIAPQNLSVRLRLAEWYYDLQKVGEAAEQFGAAADRLAAGLPKTETTMYKARTEVGMARVLKDQGKKQDALNWAMRAAASPLGHRRDVWQLIAELHQQLGDTEAAIAASDAAEKAPEAAVWPEPEMGRAAQYLRDASLLYAQAEMAWSQGDFDTAMEILLSIGDLEPDDQKWKLRLGEMFRDTNRLDDGIRFLDNMLKSHPSSARMYVMKAQMRIGQQKLPEARADCERAIELKPDYGEAHFVLGQVQILKGDLDAAAESLREATRLDSQLAGGFVALGEVLRRQGNTDEAVQQWKRAAKLLEYDFETRLRLAELLLAQGQSQEATIYLEQAIALAEKAQDAARATRARQLLEKATSQNDSNG